MVGDVNRIRIHFERAIAGVLLLVLLGRAMAGEAVEKPALTVFAAAGTTDAMTTLCAEYEKRTGVRIDRAFGASSTLARQIEAGAGADVFVSADPEWMDYLDRQDLLSPGTRRDLAVNRLALVVPASASLSIELEPGVDLAAAIDGRIAIGDPAHVPAGMYAKQALEHFGCYGALRPRIVNCSTVREALGLVETGQVAAGIVYRSDARVSKRVRVADVFPERSHERIAFQIAALRASHPETEGFVQFLTGPEAGAILALYGFDVYDEIRPAEPVRSVSVRAYPETPCGITTNGWLPTSEEWATILTSMKVAAGCVAVLAIPGVLLAYLLARKEFWGKAVVETLVHAPLVIPPVVTGYLLLILLGNNGPMGRWLHRTFGIELAFTLNGAVIAAALMALPLMVRSVRVAMELVDRRLEEAARTLGAGPIRTFLRVTIPLSLPGIVSGLILAFARSLGEFGATAVFVGSIEGRGRTLPLAIYSHLQTASGDASVVRLVVFSILLSLAAVALSEASARRAKGLMRANHAH
jgi:molybdate transport system permease protein